MKAAFLLASLLSLAILSPGEGGVTTVTLPQQVPQARDPLPIVREDELLQKVFGSGHLERFFNTSFRQHQYRVRMEDMRTLTEVMGEEAFDLSYTKDPLALVSELFQLFNDRSTLKDALSLHDRAGASQGRPPADADIETLLDRGNSFVFRFEHLPKSSLPIQDALQEVLVTTVTPHIYASGKNALALQPHTDLYDVIIIHLAGRKVWRTCVPRVNESLASTPAERAETNEMLMKTKGCSSYTKESMDAMDCDDFVMEPGDVLYMPKGVVHYAETRGSDMSVHITLGLLQEFHTWQDLLVHACLQSDIKDCAALDQVFAELFSTGQGVRWKDLIPLWRNPSSGGELNYSYVSDQFLEFVLNKLSTLLDDAELLEKVTNLTQGDQRLPWHTSQERINAFSKFLVALTSKESVRDVLVSLIGKETGDADAGVIITNLDRMRRATAYFQPCSGCTCFACDKDSSCDCSCDSWWGRGSCDACCDGGAGCDGGCSCSAGFVGLSSFRCNRCPSGTYAWASLLCFSCPSGKYSTGGTTTCLSCVAGKYQNSAGQSSCMSCPRGQYQDSTGQSACKTIPTGYYVSNNRVFQCPVGYYCSNGNMVACPAGKYQSSRGMTYCNSCPSSSYQPFLGQSGCRSCSTGYYRSTDGSSQIRCQTGYRCSSCQRFACNAGTFQSLNGQTFCTSCSKGTYSTSASSICSSCTAGTYQDQFSQSSCKSCPSSQYQNQAGQASCKSCSSGYYRSSSGAAAYLCPLGHACPGSCALSKCQAGYYSPSTGRTSCVPCPSGTFQDQTGASSCKSCPSNAVSSPGSSSCTSCTSGKYKSGSSVLPCLSGHYCPSNCNIFACPAGQYQAQSGASSCQKCPSTTFQPSAGQTACRSCSAGFYAPDGTRQTPCPAGYFCPGSCQLRSCSPGTYSSSGGQSSCSSCPAGKYSSGFRATSCTSCPPGTYQDGTGQNSCKSCPNGSIQTGSGATSCQNCPVGKYSVDSVSTANCPAGFFCPGNCQRLSCSVGQYQDQTAQGSCKFCSSNQYQDQTGTSSCKTITSTCAAGFYEKQSPSSSVNRVCVACDGVNSFQDVANQRSCKTATVCRSGQYIVRELTARSDRVCGRCKTADECSPRQYLAGVCQGTSQPTCQACFGACATCSGPSSNQCTSCPPGYGLSKDGQCISQCSPGQYQSTSGCKACEPTCKECDGGLATSCTLCGTGRALDIMSGRCTLQCNVGFFISTKDECEACSTCTASQFQKQLCSPSADTMCAPLTNCPSGTYVSVAATATTDRKCSACDGIQNYQDQTNVPFCKPLTQCETGQKIVAKASASNDRTCAFCTPGYFSTAANSNDCSQCPKGKFTSSNGARACQDCGPGFYSDSLGSTSCKQISPGNYGVGGTASTRTGASPCPVGYRCAGGNSDDELCKDAEEYQDQIGQSRCKPASLCLLGQYSSTPTTVSTDRKCSNCPVGKFQDDVSHVETSCDNVNPCKSGEFQIAAATSTSDFVCSTCGDNFYVSEKQCAPVSQCNPGTYVFQSETTTTDRSCKTCPSGKYNDKSNLASCKTHRTCRPGFYVASGATSSSDRECINCEEGQEFSSVSNAPACIPLTTCASGSYVSATGSTTSDRQCSSCPAETFRSTSAHTGTSCAMWTDCGSGTYISTDGTSSTDRYCSSCSSSQYQDQANQRSCKNVPTGYYRVSASSVEQCPAGTRCVDGVRSRCDLGESYQDQSGQTECKSVTYCKPGFKVRQLPTISSDAECTPCDSGTFNSDISLLGTCRLITDCQPGQYVETQPTSSSDRACDVCDPSNPTQGFSTTTNADKCTPVSVCPAGKVESSGPTSSNDRTCDICSLGISYMHKDGNAELACIPVSPPCSPGTYQSIAPTISSDRTCTPCPTGSFQDEPDQSSCKPISGCPPGERIVQDASAKTDRVCSNCDGITQFSDRWNATTCTTVKSCPDDAYISTLATPVSDLACSTCLKGCDAGEYLEGTCGGTSNKECKDCHPTCQTCSGPTATQCLTCPGTLAFQDGECKTDCDDGQYKSSNVCVDCDSTCKTCSSSHDCTSCETGLLDPRARRCVGSCPPNYFALPSQKLCELCTICGLDEFEVQPCTPSTERTCTKHKTCQAGTFVKTEGTFSTDRVCEKCGDGTYQDQANRPTCKTGRVCDVGHYVSTPLTPSSNRDCGLCSAGTYSDSVNEATCKICIEGTAQPQIGQARCFECGTSAYSDTKKALSCKRIEPGFYGVGGTATMKTGVQMCSPGFACPGGSSPRLRCDGETEYSPGYGNITCSKVSLCSVGEYESHAPSQSSNRICADCPVGTFMDKRLHHAKACQPHSTCAPGTFVLTEGSSFTDTVCSRCDGITGYSSAPNQGACTPIESCRPGEFVAREPSAMQPRFCSPCPDGTYSAHSNADRCVDVQTCLPGQAVALASTASRNRICVNCIAGQSYSTFPNAPECIATTTCAPGELTSSPATKTSDRQCIGCPLGSYSDVSSSSGKCQVWRECNAGFYVQEEGTSTSDRLCARCHSDRYQDEPNQASCKQCDDGWYATSSTGQAECPIGHRCVECNRIVCELDKTYQDLTGQSECKPVTFCSAGQKVVQMPTISSDTVCVECEDGAYNDDRSHLTTTCTPHTVCQPGTYVSRLATISSNRACSPCDGNNFFSTTANVANCTLVQTCVRGEIVSADPTPTSDRVCTKCTEGETYQDETNHDETFCKPIRAPCDPGFYLLRAPTISNDRVCSPCLTGTFSTIADATSCFKHQDCPTGTRIQVSGGPTNDAECTPCDSAVSYQDQPNQANCKPFQVCASNQYAFVEGTSTTDRQCRNCVDVKDCGSRQYLNGTCTNSASPVCRDCHATCATCSGPGDTDCVTCPASSALSEGKCLNSCELGNYKGTAGSCVSCHETCRACDGPGPNSCTSCSAGSHLDLNSRKCVNTCPSGFYQDTTNKICLECTACPSGHFISTVCQNETDTVCTKWTVCPLGTYESKSPSLNADRACLPCAKDEYQDQRNQPSCKVPKSCQSGYFVDTDFTTTSDRVCAICRAGSAALGPNSRSCSPCPPGQVQSQDGQSVCRNCGPGMYQSESGKQSCLAILPGFYGTGGTPVTRTGQSVCERGFACVGREHDRVACEPDVTYQDQLERTSCKLVSSCGRGEAESVPPTTSSDRQCTTCPEGFYVGNVLHTRATCAPHTVCQPGEYILVAGTTSTDNECAPCNGFSFFSDSENLARCNTTRTCPRGSVVSVQPGPANDRQCDACPDGTYSNEVNAESCIDLDICPAGTHVSVPGTSSTDRKCDACRFDVEYSDRSNALACTPLTHCLAGQRQLVDPTAFRDRECGPCPAGKYQDASIHDLTYCKQWKTCLRGSYVVSDGTSSSDRACLPCPVNTYSISSNAGECSPVTFCQAGQFEQRANSGTNDRVCQDCQSGKFMDKADHTENDCKVVSTCPKGTYIDVPATSNSDVVCKPCSPTTGFSDSENQQSCKPLTECALNQYVSQPSTSTSDQVCTDCTTESLCLPNQFLTGVCGGDAGDSNPRCLFCHPTCSSCVGRTERDCLECAGTLSLLNGTCTSDCPTKSYPDDLDRRCKDCHSSCADCFGPDNDECTSCDGNLYLTRRGECVTACGSGYFKGDANVCEVCDRCEHGLFSSTICSENSNTECSPHTQCLVGQQQTIAPSNITDRKCDTCPLGSYQDEPNQLSCKPVRECITPEVEVTAPTSSSDRICACDRENVCEPRVNLIFADYLCRAPSSSEFEDRVNACCNFATIQSQINSITEDRTLEYNYLDRHRCEGCTASCSCQIGFVNVPTTLRFNSTGDVVNATVCQTCPTGTYSDLIGMSCQDFSTCDPGYYENRPGTTSSDRKCQPCPAGSADEDRDFSTPCTPCIDGLTYQPSEGRTQCLYARNCTVGYGMIQDATTVHQRHCEPCYAGYFKNYEGNEPCISTTVCAEGEMEIAAPTSSTDRQCDRLTYSTLEMPVNITFARAEREHALIRQNIVDALATSPNSTSIVNKSIDAVLIRAVDSTRARESADITGITVVFFDGDLRQSFLELVLRGELTILDVTIWPCPNRDQFVDYELASKIGGRPNPDWSNPTNPFICTTRTKCQKGEYESIPANQTRNSVCSIVTQSCALGEFSIQEPTYSSDRVCAQASTAPVKKNALSGVALAMIVLMVLILAVAMAGLAIWHRRKATKDNRQRDMIETMASQMSMDANDTLKQGNGLLRHLSGGGVLFDNPTFTTSTGRQTLRKRPRWFVGQMTRADAEAHLLSKPGPQCGDFVVRESSANGNFVLSILLDRNTFEHHQLTQDAQGRFRINGNLFLADCLTVEDVVKHLAEEMDGTSALLNLAPADLAELEFLAASDSSYGAAVPETEDRNDFYGSVVKDVDQLAPPSRPNWLHGEMSRQDAEILLQSDLSPGNFLIRESKGRPGTFAISLVIPDGRIEHHTLQAKNGAFVLNGKSMTRACSTLDDVVDHLTYNEEGLTCCLRPSAPRSIVANPGYAFSDGTANPLFDETDDAEDFYTATPSSLPVNSSTGMYYEADANAPPIPSKSSTLRREDIGYMDLGPTGIDEA